MMRPHRLPLWILAAVLALMAPGADAATRAHHRRAPRPALPGPPAAAGMVVGVDPEAGLLGLPSRAQAAALVGLPGLSLNHSSDGLVPRRLPDGSLMLDLQGRFREYYLVHVDPQGRVVPQCLDDPVAIRRALVTPLPPAALEER